MAQPPTSNLQSPISNLQSPTSNLQPPTSNLRVRRIAAYRALFLGDLVVALPAFRALKERFPGAEVTLIGLPWAADFVARTPYIDRLLPFPGYPGINEVPVEPVRTARFLEEARANPYDLAIQMHGDGSVSNGFVADLGARLTLGYRREGDERLDIALPYVDGEHEVGRWLKLVAGDWRLEISELGIGKAGAEAVPSVPLAAPNLQPPISNLQSPTSNLQPQIPELTTTPAEQARADALLARLPGDGPLIALHAGAKDPERRWPPERFAAVGDALAKRYGARLVLSGGAGERDITAAVQRHMRALALGLAGETDLGTFIALIARLDLLLTNDTGASHLASTTGTRSVVLFGPGRPEQWAPPNRRLHRVVDAAAITGAPPDDSIALLPVGPVLMACEEMLAADRRRQTAEEALLVSEVGGRQPVAGGR